MAQIEMTTKFRKIPVFIFKDSDPPDKNYCWSVELPDNWKNYKTTKYEDLCLESLGFHFWLDTSALYRYNFPTRKAAVENAKKVIEDNFKNKGKIHYF